MAHDGPSRAPTPNPKGQVLLGAAATAALKPHPRALASALAQLLMSATCLISCMDSQKLLHPHGKP